jgi:hypothetical protein
VQWPDPRFIDNSDGTVTDNLTGLIWVQEFPCLGVKTWYEAVSATNALAEGACGLADGSTSGDWRLPTVPELLSLTNYWSEVYRCHLGFTGEIDPFVDDVTIWTGTAYHWWESPLPGDRVGWFSVTWGPGSVGVVGVAISDDWGDPPSRLHVWPVRGGN